MGIRTPREQRRGVVDLSDGDKNRSEKW